MIQYLKNEWQHTPIHKSWVFQLLAMIFVLVTISLILDPESSNETKTLSSRSIDTLIPRDHTLIPIEVLNFDSVNAVLGSYGVVDIYTAKQQQPVARKVKITRAPRDPNQFHLLVPATEAAHIVRAPGPFQVVIRHPQSIGTDFVKESKIEKRRILIGQSVK